MKNKHKAIAWALRILAVAATVGLPFAVVYTKFPLWRAQGGRFGAIGAGAIILLIVIFVTFKKYILAWATEKLGTLSAGVSLVLLWSTAAIICLAIAAITTIVQDLATVFIFAAIGAAVGVGLFSVAKMISGDEEGRDGKDH